MKVAIVHDWLVNMGGGERIIKILHELFPEAPIYTAVFDKSRMPAEFTAMDIRTTFIQRMPFGKKRYQSYLPLMPLAFEQLDLTEYDLVISSSTSCAKGVITRSDTLHICYCNTPMRYAWDFYFEYIRDKGALSRIVIGAFMNYIRMWDRLSADRVDFFIANSQNVANRIKKHYKRDSDVIHPPVNAGFYKPSGLREDFYLIVSRLVRYKRLDLAVQAFSELGIPLKIIGSGGELERLKSAAKGNIEFLGRLSDDETNICYSRCKAFVFPGEEDFGITPLEAQACGKPVIAYGKGGALETVIEGKTGIFFLEQSVESLKEAVIKMESSIDSFDMQIIREHAERFDEGIFKANINEYIKEKYQEFNNNPKGDF